MRAMILTRFIPNIVNYLEQTGECDLEITELQEAFIRTIHRFRQDRNWHWAGGLTQAEFYALYQIHEHMQSHPGARGVYVSALAGRVRVSPPAVSRMLRGLERRGLVDRAVDRADRRNTYVMLTPAGEAARRDTIRQLNDYICQVLERMGREDMETLIRLWNRLADVMTEERAKENTP